MASMAKPYAYNMSLLSPSVVTAPEERDETLLLDSLGIRKAKFCRPLLQSIVDCRERSLHVVIAEEASFKVVAAFNFFIAILVVRMCEVGIRSGDW